MQRIMENARGDLELQSLYQAIRAVEQQIMSRPGLRKQLFLACREPLPGAKEEIRRPSQGECATQDPREVFKHIQNYLQKA